MGRAPRRFRFRPGSAWGGGDGAAPQAGQARGRSPDNPPLPTTQPWLAGEGGRRGWGGGNEGRSRSSHSRGPAGPAVPIWPAARSRMMAGSCPARLGCCPAPVHRLSSSMGFAPAGNGVEVLCGRGGEGSRWRSRARGCEHWIFVVEREGIVRYGVVMELRK